MVVSLRGGGGYIFLDLIFFLQFINALLSNLRPYILCFLFIFNLFVALSAFKNPYIVNISHLSVFLMLKTSWHSLHVLRFFRFMDKYISMLNKAVNLIWEYRENYRYLFIYSFKKLFKPNMIHTFQRFNRE